MYGYIYETTNLINNKKYIGKKVCNKFLAEKYLGSGVYLEKAINKYGKENFKVKLIEECDSKEDLCNKEKYWIKYFNAIEDNNYYNLAKGGEGWNYNHIGKHHTEETKKKISKSQKGKKLSEEHKNNISKGNKIRFQDIKEREKISKANKGKVSGMKNKHQSEYAKQKISEYMKHRNISKETRNKLSKSLTGKHMSEETKKKISETRIKKKISAWNKGLTKETDERVAQYGKTQSETKNRR